MSRRPTTAEPSLFGATPAPATITTPSAPPPPSKPPAPQVSPAGVRVNELVAPYRARDGWWYVGRLGGRCFRTLAEANAYRAERERGEP